MTPDGVVDNVQGIRSIDVGTGGESTALPVAIHPNSEVISDAFGVLKVTLYADHYTWQFVPMQGQSFSDQGSGTCHCGSPEPPLDFASHSPSSKATIDSLPHLSARPRRAAQRPGAPWRSLAPETWRAAMAR